MNGYFELLGNEKSYKELIRPIFCAVLVTPQKFTIWQTFIRADPLYSCDLENLSQALQTWKSTKYEANDFSLDFG